MKQTYLEHFKFSLSIIKFKNIYILQTLNTTIYLFFQRLKHDYDKIVAEKNELHRQCFIVS